MRLRRRVRKRIRMIRAPKRKVDFAVAGTQKGGTTALDRYLRMHPQICMANKKEVHFFDNERLFRTGRPNYAIYHSYFDADSQHRLLGEASPIYMYWRSAPKRIWEYNPEMKILLILRNPWERAYSHWNMERDRNAESLTFWSAIQSEPERSREALPYQHRVYSYVDRGFYVEQIRRLWSYFDREQTLILRNEELRARPLETMNRVFDFLGVDSLQEIRPARTHARPYVSEITRREKEYLLHAYEYEIRALERILGWDCSNWLDD